MFTIKINIKKIIIFQPFFCRCKFSTNVQLCTKTYAYTVYCSLCMYICTADSEEIYTQQYRNINISDFKK